MMAVVNRQIITLGDVEKNLDAGSGSYCRVWRSQFVGTRRG